MTDNKPGAVRGKPFQSYWDDETSPKHNAIELWVVAPIPRDEKLARGFVKYIMRKYKRSLRYRGSAGFFLVRGDGSATGVNLEGSWLREYLEVELAMPFAEAQLALPQVVGDLTVLCADRGQKR